MSGDMRPEHWLSQHRDAATLRRTYGGLAAEGGLTAPGTRALLEAAATTEVGYLLAIQLDRIVGRLESLELAVRDLQPPKPDPAFGTARGGRVVGAVVGGVAHLAPKPGGCDGTLLLDGEPEHRRHFCEMMVGHPGRHACFCGHEWG